MTINNDALSNAKKKKNHKLDVPALDNNRRLILSSFENRGKLNFR
jgi:hypothetical protein